MNKSIIYYTNNKLPKPIFYLVQQELKKAGLPIISSSREQINFGENEVIKGEDGYHTMVEQIISCLERAKTKYVFFCEHDVLYPKAHFDFVPTKDNVFYYDENAWRWKYGSDIAIRHDRMISLSSLCVNREYALNHYKLRQKSILSLPDGTKKTGEPDWARKMGYEPGTKKKRRGGITDDDYETWYSSAPMIDIRHKVNFSSPKVSLKDFKHQPKWWREKKIDDITEWDLRKMFNIATERTNSVS